jgi:hypothetical protein
LRRYSLPPGVGPGEYLGVAEVADFDLSTEFHLQDRPAGDNAQLTVDPDLDLFRIERLDLDPAGRRSSQDGRLANDAAVDPDKQEVLGQDPVQSVDVPDDDSPGPRPITCEQISFVD